MNTIDTNQLLMQLRAATAQATGTPAQQEVQPSGDNFSSMLTESIDMVNRYQKASGNLQEEFLLGNKDVSLTDVMIAKGKAGVAFEGMVQVRNKVVEAYQEIMRMPV